MTAMVSVSDFFICNGFDRPCEDLVAVRLHRHPRLFYVGPRLSQDPGYADGVSTHDDDPPVPVTDFGVRLSLAAGGNVLEGECGAPATARYADGRPRRWQGSPRFRILLPGFAFYGADPRRRRRDFDYACADGYYVCVDCLMPWTRGETAAAGRGRACPDCGGRCAHARI